MKRYLSLLLFAATLQATAQTLTFGPDHSNLPAVEGVDDIALVVNQEAVSRSRLNRELQNARAALPPDLPLNEAQIAQMVMERVIMQILIAQMAQTAGISIDDSELDAAISRIAAQNNLSEAQLFARVAGEGGMSTAAYRETVRAQIVQAQLQERLVGDSVRISPEQINDQLTQIARQQGSSLHLQDLLLPVPDLPVNRRAAAIHDTMTRISAALKTHNDDLALAAAAIPEARFTDLGSVNIGQIPRRFATAIVDLRGGEMVNNPVIDQDGMHFLKVVSKSVEGSEGYIVPEARMAHILIRRNPQNPEAAKAEIERLYARLQQGADFAALAQQYSHDAGSAVKGGELGWMSADSVDPRFAAQMSQVEPGTVSAPFESAFGWHILKVHERREQDRSEDRLRERIRDALYQSALQEAWERRLLEARRNAYIRQY